MFRRIVLTVHYTSGDLQFDRVGSMSKLFDHHQFIVRGDRDHIHPVAAFDHDKIMFLSGSRGLFDIRTNREDPKVPLRSGSYGWPWLNHRNGYRMPFCWAAHPCFIRSSKCKSAAS